MALGPPTGTLAVKRLTWRKGTKLHRFHSRERWANAFNPCQGRPGRFNPLIDAVGRCIPTLYGADSLRCIVLFGDRVDERDLAMVTGPVPLAADDKLYDAVAVVGARAGIIIVED